MDESFHVDWRAHKLTTRAVLFRRFLKDLDAEEVEEILAEEGVTVFLNTDRDTLTPVAPRDLKDFWQNQLRNHIASDSNGVDFSQFWGGYCYLASLWKGHGGSKILLLVYVR